MADTKISDATARTSTVGTEMIPVAVPSDSTPYKMTVAASRVGANAAAASDAAGTGLQFTAGDGDGTGGGGSIQFTAGNSPGEGNGGHIAFTGGAAGNDGGGGDFRYSGGFSGSAGSASGTAEFRYTEDVDISGGDEGSSPYTGKVNIRSGLSTATYGTLEGWFPASIALRPSFGLGAPSIRLVGASAQAGNYKGADIDIAGGAGSGTGLSGEVMFNAQPSFIPISGSWNVGETPDGKIVGVATRALRVKAVIGSLGAANAGASTCLVAKAASGVAPGSAVALTSNSVNCAGTANTNQTLTLSATPADLQLAAGDRLILISTGTFVLSNGAITVWTTPV